MPIAKRRPGRLERLAEQRHGLLELAFGIQQRPQIVDGSERARVPIAKCHTPRFDRLAVQGLSLIELGLVVQ